MQALQFHNSMRDKNVIILEDNYFIAAELRQVFEDTGANVLRTIPSVADALVLLKENPRIDGAVLDINLRGEMAYQIADKLSTRGVPFIFATGYGACDIDPAYRYVVRWEKPGDTRMVVRALAMLM